MEGKMYETPKEFCTEGYKVVNKVNIRNTFNTFCLAIQLQCLVLARPKTIYLVRKINWVKYEGLYFGENIQEFATSALQITSRVHFTWGDESIGT